MAIQNPKSKIQNPIRMAFVMEQHSGLRTQYFNWRAIVEQEEQIQAKFIPIVYHDKKYFLEKFSFLPKTLRAIGNSYALIKNGLGNEKYDILLYNTFNPAVTYQKPMLRQPTFLMYDVTPKQYDTMSKWYWGTEAPSQTTLIAKWKHNQVKKTFQAATGHLCWSNWAAKSAIEDYGVDPKKISILPPGVDTNIWKPEPQMRPNDGITRILFTGGNFERKGGDLLLRWAKETKQKNWELHLVTIDTIDPIPQVFVYNNIDSNSNTLRQLAQKCEMFVLPTRADCFSIASLEAMSAGLPVIVSDVGGISDIVQEEKTGFLIPPDDYEALCERMDRLINSQYLREKMGNLGRERVCQHFELRNLVLKGLEIMMEKSKCHLSLNQNQK